MQKQFEIVTIGQRENLIHLLLESVAQERKNGNKLLEEGSETASRLPIHGLQTLRKNLEIRIAVATKLAADIKDKQLPLTFEKFVYQFLDSFAAALNSGEAANIEYKNILNAIVTTPTVPASVIERAGKDPDKYRGTMVPVKPDDLTPQKVEILEMCHMGVQNTISLVSTAFFKASAKKPKVKQTDPDYIAFARKLEGFFGGSVHSR